MARWITGIILSAIAVYLLLFAQPFYLKAIVIILSLLASFEFFNVTIKFAAVGKNAVGAALTILGVWLNLFTKNPLYVYMFIYAVLFIGFVLEFFGSTHNSVKIKQTAFFVFGVFYITFLFSMVGLICDLPQYRFWLFLILGATHLGDTGAYIVGKLIGKHKLAPDLSPGKTIEGLAGAVVFAIGAVFVVRYFFWPDFNGVILVLLGILIALVGVIGDLCESLLKRGFGIKDMGNLIPGHGGVLDRMDSLMFTAPLVYFLTFWIS